MVLTSCSDVLEADKLQTLIKDNEVATHEFVIQDAKSALRYEMEVSCRRLGDDSANDLLYDYGVIIKAARDMLLARSRRLTQEEMIAMLAGNFGEPA